MIVLYKQQTVKWKLQDVMLPLITTLIEDRGVKHNLLVNQLTYRHARRLLKIFDSMHTHNKVLKFKDLLMFLLFFFSDR